MDRFSLEHVTDDALLKGLEASVERERDSHAKLLAFIAEIDARKIHVAAGYSSLHDYCVRELHMSEDTADELIQAHQQNQAGTSDEADVIEVPMTAATYAKWLRLKELLTEHGRAPSDTEVFGKLLDFLLEEASSQKPSD